MERNLSDQGPVWDESVPDRLRGASLLEANVFGIGAFQIDYVMLGCLK
jgi:hypothetical protein